jgi:hypothetical protein
MTELVEWVLVGGPLDGYRARAARDCRLLRYPQQRDGSAELIPSPTAPLCAPAVYVPFRLYWCGVAAEFMRYERLDPVEAIAALEVGYHPCGRQWSERPLSRVATDALDDPEIRRLGILPKDQRELDCLRRAVILDNIFDECTRRVEIARALMRAYRAVDPAG